MPAFSATGPATNIAKTCETASSDIRLLETTPAPRKGEKGYIPDPGDKDEQQ